MIGVVCWFSNRRGYGFIQCDGDKRDVFVHYANIDMDGYKYLKQGQKVEFEIQDIPKKGPNAINVRIID